jgi:signal transduction histidine kinase
MVKVKKFLSEKLTNKEFKSTDGINFWREKILNSLLLVLVVFGFFAYLLGVYLSIVNNFISIAIADSLAYGLLIWLFLSNKVRLVHRMYFIVSVVLVLAAVLLFVLGPYGAGLVYLVGFSILTSILFGLRAAIISLIVQLLVIVIIALGIWYRWFAGMLIMDFQFNGWLAVSVNTLVISSITSIPLAVIVDGLKLTHDKQQKLQLSLEEKIEEYLAAKEKAEESDRLKSRFLTNMNHEIRTPLNALMGFSDLLTKNTPFSEEQKAEFQKTIKQSGQKLLTIIENILSAAMLDTQQMKFYKRQVSCSAFFNQIKEEYQPKLDNLGFYNLLFEEPEENVENKLFIDIHRIKQSCFNLIENAVKFCPTGTIVVGYELSQNTFKFYVKDNGIGISEENQEVIFRQFTQLEPDTAKISGNGLGLAISKGIIKAHHGEMGVQSSPGKGSTFYFTLPLVENQH